MSIFPGVSGIVWNYNATAPRRVAPFILAAIHITGNPALPSAMQEAVYSNRFGSGASFHFCVNRNGTYVQCLHPESQVAFTNGAWVNSNWNLPTVRRAITQRYGANDATFLTIENVGFEWNFPISSLQIETCAKIVAYGSKISGIPISRETVLGHRDYNSVDRYYCPTGGNLDHLLGLIITRARQINAVQNAPPPATNNPLKGFPVKFRPVPNTKMQLRAGTAIRTSPHYLSTGNSNITYKLREPGWYAVIGETVGDPIDGHGRWMVFWETVPRTTDEFDGALRYFHKQDIIASIPIS